MENIQAQRTVCKGNLVGSVFQGQKDASVAEAESGMAFAKSSGAIGVRVPLEGIKDFQQEVTRFFVLFCFCCCF